MLIVTEGMLLFKEFMLVYFMRNIYTCIEFSGL